LASAHVLQGSSLARKVEELHQEVDTFWKDFEKPEIRVGIDQTFFSIHTVVHKVEGVP
jgi:hypothetical protein